MTLNFLSKCHLRPAMTAAWDIPFCGNRSPHVLYEYFLGKRRLHVGGKLGVWSAVVVRSTLEGR